MNVSFNTNNYTNPSLYNRNTASNSLNCCKPKPAFTGSIGVFEKKYDDVAVWIGKNVTRRIVDSKPMGYLANRFKDTNIFQHCLTIGSAITSGLYMYKTATNDKLEKDRRNTLTVNQGLTFIVSTIGAYTLDGVLNKWWEKQAAKFISIQLKDNDKFYNKFIETNNDIAKENEKLKAAAKGTGKKPELKSAKKALNMLYENKLYKNMLGKEQDILNTKVKGFGALKSMLVFGMVYRYIVPVMVTKPANKLCEMYLEHKKNKQAEKTQQA